LAVAAGNTAEQLNKDPFLKELVGWERDKGQNKKKTRKNF
jgi:hypothetical protein